MGARRVLRLLLRVLVLRVWLLFSAAGRGLRVRLLLTMAGLLLFLMRIVLTGL